MYMAGSGRHRDRVDNDDNLSSLHWWDSLSPSGIVVDLSVGLLQGGGALGVSMSSTSSIDMLTHCVFSELGVDMCRLLITLREILSLVMWLTCAVAVGTWLNSSI